MSNLGWYLLCTFQLILVVNSLEYKVGDLNAWGVPSEVNPQVYNKWSKYHSFKIGDSLLFLYPPSQDSVIQVTEESYKSCNIKDPILYMNNGNSLFNISGDGNLYFTSGAAGHCEKRQKLQISVGLAASATSPSQLPDTAPSYPTVFGSIPQPPSSSSSSSSSFPPFPLFLSAVLGLLIGLIM
ncbi:mavicyanin [Carica papaya]|uniref:mavicyanin n=1 Tax=Carica papaya TaxID=3649 RepID=UPI000B8C6E66|nr:mavicyanin [Carica papaya]